MRMLNRRGCDAAAAEVPDGRESGMREPIRRNLTRALAQRLLGATAFLMLGLACASEGLRVSLPVSELPRAGPYMNLATVLDTRSFTTASNRAPVPSLRGDPMSASLTERVVGRWLAPSGRLGSNVLLEPPQSVPALVGRAIVFGLRTAGYRAVGENPSVTGPAVDLHATVSEFWIYQRPHGALAYRARIILSGSLLPLRGGRIIEINGSVSAGAVDGVLWRRAVERCLEMIAEEVSRSVAHPIDT